MVLWEDLEWPFSKIRFVNVPNSIGIAWWPLGKEFLAFRKFGFGILHGLAMTGFACQLCRKREIAVLSLNRRRPLRKPTFHSLKKSKPQFAVKYGFSAPPRKTMVQLAYSPKSLSWPLCSLGLTWRLDCTQQCRFRALDARKRGPNASPAQSAPPSLEPLPPPDLHIHHGGGAAWFAGGAHMAPLPRFWLPNRCRWGGLPRASGGGSGPGVGEPQLISWPCAEHPECPWRTEQNLDSTERPAVWYNSFAASIEEKVLLATRRGLCKKH